MPGATGGSPSPGYRIEPGERHDGQALQETGFRYSMLYLPQGWLRDAMGGSDAGIGFRRTLADDRQLGGAILAADLARRMAIDRALLVDIGGTTAKLCFIDDGMPQTARAMEVARLARFKQAVETQ